MLPDLHYISVDKRMIMIKVTATTILLVVYTFSVFPKGRENYTIHTNSSIEALYTSFSGTRAQLEANTNTFYLSAQTTDYGAGSWWKISNTSFGYTENSITCIIDAAGQVWTLNHKEDEILINWFLPAPALADTADKTTYIQQALNASIGKKLVFDPVYKYLQRTVYPSDNTLVDFNSAVLIPHQNIVSGAALYYIEDTRLNFEGRYIGSSMHATRSKRKMLKGVKFMNGVFRMNNFNAECIVFLSTGSKWTEIDRNTIENCASYNCSGRSFVCDNSPYITDSTTRINHAVFNKLKTYYNGQNIGLFIDTKGNIGDTSVYVKTIDKTAINNRIGLGQYIKFGSAGNNTITQLNGYGTTNKIYQVKRFAVDDNDSARARIDITGGSYDAANGFIDSAMGLTAIVAVNTMYIPVEGWNTPLLTVAPKFDGIAGATTLTRTTIEAQQDAQYKNLVTGMYISFFRQPGNYKIIAKTANTITLDRPLLSSFTNVSSRINGTQNDAVSLTGYIKNAELTNGFFYANMHGLFFTDAGGKDIYQENLDNNLKVDSNTFWYSWMSIESPPGTIVLATMDKSGFHKTVNKGDTSFSVSKSKYRIENSTDVDKDGINDISLTNAGTLTANITWKNCISVGDILGSPRLHYRYKLTSITDAGTDSIRLGFQRWDNHIKNIAPGGFDAGTFIDGNVSKFDRVYSIYSGEVGVVKKQDYTNNKFYYNWRENSGGYGISVKGYNVNVQKNIFESASQSAIEISGYSLIAKNNTITNYTFDGTRIMPAIFCKKMYENTGVGAGGLGTFATANVEFTNNIVDFHTPSAADRNDYSWFTGSVHVTYSTYSLSPPERFNYSGNKISGVRSNLFLSNEQDPVNSSSSNYTSLVFYYNEAIISNNIITLSKDYNLGTGPLSVLMSTNMRVINNSFIGTSNMAGRTFNIFGNTGLNPKLVDTTNSFKTIIVSGNKYPAGTVPNLNLRFSKNKITWKDDK